MGRRLVGALAARDPESGLVRVFRSGDEVPDWAESQATDDAVFATEKPAAKSSTSTSAAAKK